MSFVRAFSIEKWKRRADVRACFHDIPIYIFYKAERRFLSLLRILQLFLLCFKRSPSPSQSPLLPFARSIGEGVAPAENRPVWHARSSLYITFRPDATRSSAFNVRAISDALLRLGRNPQTIVRHYAARMGKLFCRTGGNWWNTSPRHQFREMHWSFGRTFFNSVYRSQRSSEPRVPGYR